MKDNKLSLKDVIQMGVQAGVEIARAENEKFIAENIKGREDRRLRNTKLLLENYRTFIAHCNNAVVKDTTLKPIDVFADLDTILDPKAELVLDAVKRSEERTMLIIKHIKAMLNAYKSFALCSRSDEEKRRYKVLAFSYISKHKYSNAEIAVLCNISESSLYRDRCRAIEIFSRFVWGVDSLKMSKSVRER